MSTHPVDVQSTIDKIVESGSWEAALKVLRPGSMVSLLRFGNGWKAMLGQYDYAESYEYLLSCNAAPTVERAIRDLIFREHLAEGVDTYDVKGIEHKWALAPFETVKKDAVVALKKRGWGNPLTTKQTEAYEEIMSALRTAMGANL